MAVGQFGNKVDELILSCDVTGVEKSEKFAVLESNEATFDFSLLELLVLDKAQVSTFVRRPTGVFRASHVKVVSDFVCRDGLGKLVNVTKWLF